MDTVNILTQVNANQRLVMKLADFYRAQSRNEGKITLPVTKKLKNDGFITECESHITLLDIPAMCEAVELTPEIFRRSKR